MDLEQAAGEINQLCKRVTGDVIRIGDILLQVKTEQGHGKFCKWVEQSFPFSHKQATRYMNLAIFDKSQANRDKLSNMALSEAYDFVANAQKQSSQQKLNKSVSSAACNLSPNECLIQGDAIKMLRTLPDNSAHVCVTSPPYWRQRDYGLAGQYGLEPTLQAYLRQQVNVFNQVRRVLRPDGTLWVNIGDTYARKGGPLPAKSLIGMPWRLAFALQDAGWILRAEIVWAKPNAFPESCTDRPTRSHEQLFMFSKEQHYYYDIDAIREKNGQEPSWAEYQEARSGSFRNKPSQAGRIGRARLQMPIGIRHPDGINKRSVWTITPESIEGHSCPFPMELVTPCILAGCPVGGVALDPFIGSGTVALVARQHSRGFIGIDLDIALAQKRLAEAKPAKAS